jgi:hypothetical protein
MTAFPSHAEFRARLAQACSLHLAGAPAPLDGVLAEVGDRREHSGYEQFSLLFHADGPPRQGTYAVTFADGRHWELFLVPVAQEGARIVYEACFNRETVS